MRIISGSCGGRQINLPYNLGIRPTTDYAKTALFNILANQFDFDEIQVLDLFSGSGCISYEFASRGAISVVSIDKNRKCVDFIKKTSKELGFDIIKPIAANALQFIQQPTQQFDIVFADPPFALLDVIKELPAQILNSTILKPSGVFILEHGGDVNHSQYSGFFRHEAYGHVHFSFFKLPENR